MPTADPMNSVNKEKMDSEVQCMQVYVHVYVSWAGSFNIPLGTKIKVYMYIVNLVHVLVHVHVRVYYMYNVYAMHLHNIHVFTLTCIQLHF